MHVKLLFSMYTKKAWLCGCLSANALFCFLCLLFKATGADQTWTVTGVRDMKHLSEKVRKHENALGYSHNLGSQKLGNEILLMGNTLSSNTTEALLIHASETGQWPQNMSGNPTLYKAVHSSIQNL